MGNLGEGESGGEKKSINESSTSTTTITATSNITTTELHGTQPTEQNNSQQNENKQTQPNKQNSTQTSQEKEKSFKDQLSTIEIHNSFHFPTNFNNNYRGRGRGRGRRGWNNYNMNYNTHRGRGRGRGRGWNNYRGSGSGRGRRGRNNYNTNNGRGRGRGRNVNYNYQQERNNNFQDSENMFINQPNQGNLQKELNQQLNTFYHQNQSFDQNQNWNQAYENQQGLNFIPMNQEQNQIMSNNFDQGNVNSQIPMNRSGNINNNNYNGRGNSRGRGKGRNRGRGRGRGGRGTGKGQGRGRGRGRGRRKSQNTIIEVLKNQEPNPDLLSFNKETGGEKEESDVFDVKRKRKLPSLKEALEKGETIFVIKEILKQGCDVNEIYENGSNPLLIAIKKKLSPKIIKLMLKFGAEIYSESIIKNSLKIKDDLNNTIKSHYALNIDFLNCLLRRDLVNIEFERVKFHKFWVEFRIQKLFKGDPWFHIQKLQKNEISQLIKWAYCGLIESFDTMNSIIEKLNISEKLHEEKSGKYGLLNDLKVLFEDQKSKDFTIVTDNDVFELKFHKIVLMARSKFFRNYILEGNDKNKFVVTNDLKNKSVNLWKNFEYFIYFDKLNAQLPINTPKNFKSFRDLILRTRVSTTSNIREKITHQIDKKK
ncbi:fibrillarin s-adenosyl-l-methionine-dependent methyltransferase-related [Anaeramoeba flamelloides]|uniref:Fibrillarin s-adenosyl-l-methionine-dependent methyltransferase-related n=1 Tax=Anaeramoeba flamelloides TaxID=1746091 RepID=A0AAV7ZS42_9EUKA|nr:fibrillarin s-adenosyl-l-methionine-dependent methyltransferase-related [Anaeramoeba flamelloides]